MNTSVKPNPPGDEKERDLAIKQFDIASKYLAHESALYWSRSQFFLVANVALFGFLASTFRDPIIQHRHFYLLGATSLVGLVLSGLWIRALAAGHQWFDYWEAKCIELEPYAFGDFLLFRKDRERPEHKSARAVARLCSRCFAAIWLIAVAAAALELLR